MGQIEQTGGSHFKEMTFDMPLYQMVLDATLFQAEIVPALAASWRQRSFGPCRALCTKLLPAAQSYAARYHVGADDPLLFKVTKDIPFDRDFWKLLAGEMFLFAASEIPEFETAPETMLCLLSPGQYRLRSTNRDEYATIQQAFYGARDLNFGGKLYRPEHAGYSGVADVCRLAAYLASQQPQLWTADDLLDLENLDQADREEEIEFAREWYPALCDLYARASTQGQIIICELL